VIFSEPMRGFVKRPYSDESGYILVLAIFVTIALLGVTMLAIDLGHMYIWRVRLERATKSGIAAGLGYRTLNGWRAVYGSDPRYSAAGALISPPTNTTNTLSELRTQMNKAFTSTLSANQAPTGMTSAVLSANYDLKRDEASMSVKLELPTLLLGRLTIFGIPMRCNSSSSAARCEITATHTASLSPANIVLVLDTSGSMECEAHTDLSAPAPVANCGCRTSPTTPCGSGANRKLISLLKSAVHTFHGFFNPLRDRISIVPFNLGATTRFSFIDGGGLPRTFGADETTYRLFKDTIGDPDRNDGLIPFGNTNPCDALIVAAQEITSLRENPNVSNGATIRPQIVFFTDGAPNAMRGSFINQDGARLDAAKPVGQPNDWYHYSVEWNDGSPPYRAPGPLIHASYSLFNKAIDADGLPVAPVPPTPTPPAPAPTPARCGDAWYERPNVQFIGSLSASEPIPTAGRARGCLTNLDFDLPNIGSSYGVRGVPFANSTKSFHYTDQLPYYCAIEAADFIRRGLNGTVFAVGFGPNPDTCLNNDPLQDADNSFIRKDNFLGRVALDPIKTVSTAGSSCGFVSQANFQTRHSVTISGSTCPHRLTGQTFEVGYTPAGGSPLQPGAFPAGTQGEYVGTADPFRIQLSFARIAKQILFRLNQ
jgi:hypothetical protein